MIITKFIIYICLFSSLYYCSTLFYRINKADLLISIFSCNRYNYLNRTLIAFSNHLVLYEKGLKYNIIYLDQGTIERELIVEKYDIFNTIFMNPSNYTFSFKLVFSYLYTKYILLLEEDWEVVKDIEKFIFYPSFIKESILILDIVKVVYGILLRNIADLKVNYTLNVVTKMGKHILNVLKYQKSRYSFTNGVSIYRTSDLKLINYYINEYTTSQYFRQNNYRMGFTFKGLKGSINSSNTQYVMKHIGIKSARKGICNIWLY